MGVSQKRRIFITSAYIYIQNLAVLYQFNDVESQEVNPNKDTSLSWLAMGGLPKGFYTHKLSTNIRKTNSSMLAS